MNKEYSCQNTLGKIMKKGVLLITENDRKMPKRAKKDRKRPKRIG